MTNFSVEGEYFEKVKNLRWPLASFSFFLIFRTPKFCGNESASTTYPRLTKLLHFNSHTLSFNYHYLELLLCLKVSELVLSLDIGPPRVIEPLSQERAPKFVIGTTTNK